MDWNADVNIAGTLASVGARLIEGTANKMIGQTFDCMKSKAGSLIGQCCRGAFDAAVQGTRLVVRPLGVTDQLRADAIDLAYRDHADDVYPSPTRSCGTPTGRWM